ncbi:GerMN domain-containing protein [uncultured Paludibaculum sp.]|uniref:GerMN domain-containing protein n=1 Tax=uncultured Paludibaculum sp. TaxID=1765020 RepID=UPI002AAB5BD7|nr:GerMN domain-containing protein [uncultured Paludibaculum sp.]
MRRTILILAACALLSPAEEMPGIWTTTQVRDAVSAAIGAVPSLAAVTVNGVTVQGDRVTIDLSRQILAVGRPAEIDMAIRRLAATLAMLPTDAARFRLSILVDGTPLRDARGDTAAALSARKTNATRAAAAKVDNAPPANTVVLNPDSGDLDTAGTRSAELAMTIRDSLASRNLEVLGARNLDKYAGTGESGSAKWQESALAYLKELGLPADILDRGDAASRPLFANWAGASAMITLRASNTNVPLIYYAPEGTQAAAAEELALSLQTNLPGTKVIACDDCGLEMRLASMPSVILDLGEAMAEPTIQLATAGAMGESLLALSTGTRSASKAEMISPTPGSQLAGASATFQWNAGQDATSYYLMVGTWLGGNTLYSQSLGNLTSASVTGLPTNGATVYVRLWSYINEQWVSNDYQYQAYSAGGSTPTKAALTAPAAGSKLSGASTTFQWTTGVGVTRYYLFVGQWLGGNTLFSQDMADTVQATASNLPTDGSTIYVRLWSYIDGVWQSNDYTLTASGTFSPVKAQITSPAQGATLAGSTVTFQWNAGTGVTHYYLHVGQWQGGNTLFSQDMNTSQSAQVSGLPTDGSTVYVRLWSYAGGSWQYNDYTYKASGTAPSPVKAAITSPAAGSTLSGSSVTFAWSAGTAVQRYWLFVGTSAGRNDIYGADQYLNLSAAVTVPVNGKPVYVRILSYINGAWQFNDYQYTASGF